MPRTQITGDFIDDHSVELKDLYVPASDSTGYTIVSDGVGGAKWKPIKENLIVDLDHDAQKIKGYPVIAPAAYDNNKFLSYNHMTHTFEYRGAAAAGDTPPDSTAADGGLLWYNPVQNINYLFDTSRNKWLANHNILPFSRSSGNGTFMNIAGAAGRGYKLTANVTIVAAHVWYYSGTDGKIFYIYKNETSVHSMTTSGLDYVSYVLDIDFDVSDEIRVFIGAGGAIGDAICVVEAAFRYDFV